MQEYEIRIGKDVSAYATILVDLDHAPTEEEVLEIAKAHHEAENSTGLEVDWETQSGLRVLHVEGTPGTPYLFEDLPVEPVYYDAGQLLETALGGALSEASAAARVFPLLEAANFLCTDRKEFARRFLDLATDEGVLDVLRREAAGE